MSSLLARQTQTEIAQYSKKTTPIKGIWMLNHVLCNLSQRLVYFGQEYVVYLEPFDYETGIQPCGHACIV